jgi:hypothetical protein
MNATTEYVVQELSHDEGGRQVGPARDVGIHTDQTLAEKQYNWLLKTYKKNYAGLSWQLIKVEKTVLASS